MAAPAPAGPRSVRPPLAAVPRPAPPEPPRATTARPAPPPEPRVLPAVGDVVRGKYEIVRHVGEGGMAVVFEARHTRLSQRLALKVMQPSLGDQKELVARFEREARAAAQLQSINAARVIDVDMLENGLPFMVLEYLDGHDLGEEARSGPLPIDVAVDYVVQAATAMTEAHALGIVHRDLKPQNLFSCAVGSGERRLIKVLDFGISKMAEERGARLTAATMSLGTPEYMSPEQVRAEDVDARSDVWSLGVILYELVTGRVPFSGLTAGAVLAAVVADPVTPPDALRPDLPAPLARAIVRMLDKSRARRPGSMAEVIEILSPFAPRVRIGAVVAEAPRASGKLGEILVADGMVTAEQLERALVEQRKSGQLLGRVLIDLGLVSQADLMVALAKQQGIVVPTAVEKAATLPAIAKVEAAPEVAEEEPEPIVRRRRAPMVAMAIVGVATLILVAAGVMGLASRSSTAAASTAVRPPATTVVTAAAAPVAQAKVAPDPIDAPAPEPVAPAPEPPKPVVTPAHAAAPPPVHVAAPAPRPAAPRFDPTSI